MKIKSTINNNCNNPNGFRHTINNNNNIYKSTRLSDITTIITTEATTTIDREVVTTLGLIKKKKVKINE